jgi:hypothetical protein
MLVLSIVEGASRTTIVQAETKLVEAESVVCWVSPVKEVGAGLRMTCPRSEEETLS